MDFEAFGEAVQNRQLRNHITYLGDDNFELWCDENGYDPSSKEAIAEWEAYLECHTDFEGMYEDRYGHAPRWR